MLETTGARRRSKSGAALGLQCDPPVPLFWRLRESWTASWLGAATGPGKPEVQHLYRPPGRPAAAAGDFAPSTALGPDPAGRGNIAPSPAAAPGPGPGAACWSRRSGGRYDPPSDRRPGFGMLQSIEALLDLKVLELPTDTRRKPASIWRHWNSSGAHRRTGAPKHLLSPPSFQQPAGLHHDAGGTRRSPSSTCWPCAPDTADRG